jgi:hypothetical protein
MSRFADWRARRHRGLYWLAVLLALVAMVAGGVVAYVSYAATAGPDGAVKGYFAALARSDASAALGFGDLPHGPHNLLTSTVLRDQQELAPIRGVHVVSTDRSGDSATVTLRYRLDFRSGTQQVSDTVTVLRRGGSWRLAATAASTQLELVGASDRATIVGAAVPNVPLLLFPGAVPIRFDTPYLELDPATNSVRLADSGPTVLSVAVSQDGQTAMNAAVDAALTSCLAGGPDADPRCPLPNTRAVPGSLRATISGGVGKHILLTVVADPHGVIEASAKVNVTGRYTVLDFDNLPVARKGNVQLPVRATALAVEPLVVNWTEAP